MSRNIQTQSRKPTECQHTKYHIINQTVTYLQEQREDSQFVRLPTGETPPPPPRFWYWWRHMPSRYIFSTPANHYLYRFPCWWLMRILSILFFFYSLPPFSFSPFSLFLAFQLLATRLGIRRQRRWKSKKIENMIRRFVDSWVKIKNKEKIRKIHLQYETEILMCVKVQRMDWDLCQYSTVQKANTGVKVMDVCHSNIVGLINQTRRLCLNVSKPEFLHNNIQGITSYLTINTLHVHYK